MNIIYEKVGAWCLCGNPKIDGSNFAQARCSFKTVEPGDQWVRPENNELMCQSHPEANRDGSQ